MIARLIKTARSLQILHEIGQIPTHQPTSVQGKNFRLGLPCKNVLIGLKLTRDVSHENDQTCKDGRADRGLTCKENRSISIEYQKKQKA